MFGVLRAGAVLMALIPVLGCSEPDRRSSDRDLPGIVFEVDPDPDPRIVAWAGCLDTVTSCMEGGGTVRTCTTAEACGAHCVAALDRALDGAAGIEAELDAFESVFVTPGGLCRVSEADRQ